MIKKTLLLWIRFLFAVVGISYWASFIWESHGPERTLSYAVSVLFSSLLFAIVMQALQNSRDKKQYITSQ